MIRFDDGAYATGKIKVPFFLKMFPSAGFYALIVKIVFSASIKAVRNKYSLSGWYGSSRDTMRAIEKAGVKIEITGADNLAKFEGPCVIVANHMSTLETFVLPVVIGSFKPLVFIVKESLLTYPVFGPVMKWTNPIAVARKKPREDLKKVLEEGPKKLKEGLSVVVFPQSSRSTVFDFEGFNSLGVKLAKNAGVPLVPLALKTDAWGNGKRLKDFGKIDPSKKVYFSFGEPIIIEGRGTEEHKRVVDFISRRIEKWSGTAS